MSEHLPRRRLEDMTGADEAARVHLEGCARCAERRDRLEAARRRYLEAHPAADFVRAVRARAGARPRVLRPRRVFALGLGLAAAAALLLLLRRDDDPGIRLKGGASLRVFVEREGRSLELHDGDAVAPRERLAFAYSLPEPRYLVLWGEDSSGEMTQYFPAPGAAPALLPAGRGQLPVGVELDDRPGEERFRAVFSAAPVGEGEAVTIRLRKP